MNRHNIWNGKTTTCNAVISILETTGGAFNLRLSGYLNGEGKA